MEGGEVLTVIPLRTQLDVMAEDRVEEKLIRQGDFPLLHEIVIEFCGRDRVEEVCPNIINSFDGQATGEFHGLVDILEGIVGNPNTIKTVTFNLFRTEVLTESINALVVIRFLMSFRVRSEPLSGA